MVLSDEGRYQGKLDMADLLTSDPELAVAEVMKPAADTIRATAPETDVAALFERRDLISVAVLDEEDQLLGRITIDDVHRRGTLLPLLVLVSKTDLSYGRGHGTTHGHDTRSALLSGHRSDRAVAGGEPWLGA
jgi:hypothetical protein